MIAEFFCLLKLRRSQSLIALAPLQPSPSRKAPGAVSVLNFIFKLTSLEQGVGFAAVLEILPFFLPLFHNLKLKAFCCPAGADLWAALGAALGGTAWPCSRQAGLPWPPWSVWLDQELVPVLHFPRHRARGAPEGAWRGRVGTGRGDSSVTSRAGDPGAGTLCSAGPDGGFWQPG